MNYLADYPDPTTTVSIIGADSPAGPVASICINGGDIYPGGQWDESACPGNSVDVTDTLDQVEPVASPLPTALDFGGGGGDDDNGDIQLYDQGNLG
jgi:hypothetical protein